MLNRMDKNKTHYSTKYADDVIPAFLAPDYLIQEEKKLNNNSQTIIDIIDEKTIAPQALADENTHSLVVRESLHKALDQQRMDLFMQPIVNLPQRHTKFYELYGRLRLKPGQYLPAKDYLQVANEEHIVNELDTLFLTNCLNVIKKQTRLREEGFSYFINIKPYTFRSQDFMNKLLRLISEFKEVAYMLIFEMSYHDLLLLSPGERRIMDGLSRIGCRFSVDHLEDIPQDIKYMRRNNVRFAKINAESLINMGRTDRGYSELLTKKQNLEVNGIDLIVEKIEDDKALLEILDFDIKYAQGHLLGRPDFQGVYIRSA